MTVQTGITGEILSSQQHGAEYEPAWQLLGKSGDRIVLQMLKKEIIKKRIYKTCNLA